MAAPVRLVVLTVLALTGFAANSLLTRAALGGGLLDPATFTAVRLASGAAALLLLTRVRTGRVAVSGSWTSAGALAAYAIFFTIAYTRIGAGVGALVLFGSVQITMIGTGLIRGERPARVDWAGVLVALAGLVVLTRPGSTAPDLIGSILMAAGGAAWGVYSLAGRANRDPLAATAGNFLRASAPGLAFLAIEFAGVHTTTRGLLLAIVSGSLASGVGYTLWYSALPSLAAWRAGVVQLAVPVATALAAAVILGETIPARLVAATAIVISGIGLTLLPALHRRLS